MQQDVAWQECENARRSVTTFPGEGEEYSRLCPVDSVHPLPRPPAAGQNWTSLQTHSQSLMGGWEGETRIWKIENVPKEFFQKIVSMISI